MGNLIALQLKGEGTDKAIAPVRQENSSTSNESFLKKQRLLKSYDHLYISAGELMCECGKIHKGYNNARVPLKTGVSTIP